MEELSQGQNILSTDVKNNIMNYSMFDQEIHGGLDMDIGSPNQNLLKSKNNIIKQLKRKIEAYEKNAQAQNQKLSDYDHLFVEYNSLSKNFAQIQSDLDMIRNENMQLKDIINTKNQTIIDFQGLFEASKSKFDLFNQTNTALKARIEELEAKLKMYPDIMKNKEDLNQKMNDYETKIEQMKEEYNTKEELYKVKLNNQEKITKSNLHSYEEEINDLKNEIIKLKNQLDISKKKNDELFLNKKSNEEELNNKLIKFEKENEKLTKIIANLKTNINDNELLSKTENNERKNMIDKLKEEIKQITKDLSEKEEQNNTLTDALNQANIAINQSETEIQTRNNTINELIEEKNQLIKQLNDNQNDFNEYKNSSQQEIEMLHQKMLALEEERENLMNDNENNINEVNQLKNEISQYISQEKIRFEESKEADDKFSNLAKAFQIKEKEYSDEIIKLTKINQKLQNDNENLKAKYEKKINLLTLQNNEATLRVKKLINTCISLKDYAMNLERNMSNAQAGINLGQMNNSMFLPNMGGLNINSTFQGGKFTSGFQNNINEGNQNDKILNDEELNQTY
jgi:chromosome segregation ATPase